MTKTIIQRRVEQIIDEGTGTSRVVLVRMRSQGEWREPILRTASFQMLQGSLSLNPRDTLPSAKESGKTDTYRSIQEERLKVPKSLQSVSRAKMRSQSKRSIRPLLKSDPVSRHEDDPTKGALSTFLTSRTVLLDLTKDELVELADKTPEIAGIYPNRPLTIPHVIEAKRLSANIMDNKTSAWGVQAINALAVWGAYNARGRGIKVGVLDTGVDDTHPDLQGKIVGWAEFNALGQQVQGSVPHDTDQHGTHVSGTICGGTASGKYIGVAPDSKVAMGLVLNGEVGGTDAQVLAGIDWALLDEKVHVINMSLGGLTLGPDVPSTYTEAILSCLQSGVPVVTAIGNEGSQTSGSPGNDLLAFSVGATDDQDRVAGFSGGRTQIIRESDIIPDELLPLPYSKPEISAPGVAVYSSIPDGRWAPFNGTSMATPHVAGAIALLLSATTIRGNIDAAERAFFIQNLLTGSVEELGESGQDHRFGFGRLDILRAIGFAKDEGL